MVGLLKLHTQAGSRVHSPPINSVVTNTPTHRALLPQQRPGDELQQRQHPDQTFLLQAQQPQSFTQLVARHAAVLWTRAVTSAVQTV